MEGGSGGYAVPSSNSIDKSMVWDVRPLRCLVPVFPDGAQAPPFVCAHPSGPFPSGFSPFYPFPASPDQNQHNSFQMPAPLRSFVPATPRFAGASNGQPVAVMDTSGDGPSAGRKRGRAMSSDRNAANGEIVQKKEFNGSFGSAEREDGNRELVQIVLMTFDALRRRLNQLDDSKEPSTGTIKRADLKAGNILMSKGIRTNMKKRIGAVPGVEVGDIFFFRMELCVVGLHAQSMGGIDYMVSRGKSEEDTVALSIVSAGGYDDAAEDADVLVYTGQGGNSNKNGQASDQKLERGNLALERSWHRGNEVRVIRGVNYPANTSSKVYIYDGLYKIHRFWMELAKSSGCNVFKYKLERVPGQPAAFAIWKSIQKWKEGHSLRPGLIVEDLSSGAEGLPVSLVNDVDHEKPPAYFSYYSTVKYSKLFKLVQRSFGCSCHSACQPGNGNCSCIRKNGGHFPYTAQGVLVCRKSMIYECGPSCPCFPNCKNRVSQTGLKVHLEIFKTRERGWGLRSLDPIRAGTFICEYAGEVIDEINVSQDEYVFDTSRIYDSFKWNFEPALVEEDESPAPSEDYGIPCSLIISAKKIGNMSRFMNHSCSPNVFWQPVIYEHNNESFLHIAFFAKTHIAPMTELTYDYGIIQSDEDEPSGPPHGGKKCLCGSPKCRGYFY